MVNIIKAPQEFSGDLETLFQMYAKYVLLEPEVVIHFHKCITNYYSETLDPLYLVRVVKNLARGKTIITDVGKKISPTDNSPSWWIHYQLFTNQFQNFDSISKFLESIPCHIHEVKISGHINKQGWHIAHIFNVKNGDTSFQNWDEKELLRRTIRNIHPCNYFYVPKTEWEFYGENDKVIAFFYKKFEAIYKPIWNDFLGLANGEIKNFPEEVNSFMYLIPKNYHCHKTMQIQSSNSENQGDFKVEYNSSRLCFLADKIEPLGWDEFFCIKTPKGTFAMTKQQFYSTFPNVVNSASYRNRRIYHYPNTPKKAFQYKTK